MRGDNPELHLFIRGLLGRKIALEWTGFGWKALLECQWVPVEDLMIRHSVVNLALIRLSRSNKGQERDLHHDGAHAAMRNRYDLQYPPINILPSCRAGGNFFLVGPNS